MSDDDKRWDDRTDRMTFEVWRGDKTVSSVWTNSVRNAFRKQAKLQGAREAAAKLSQKRSRRLSLSETRTWGGPRLREREREKRERALLGMIKLSLFSLERKKREGELY